jgi:dipeptidyl aminopeptidase/acylaminoacyl peptidase
MRAQSPLYHAGQVVRPVLIIQGANDVRVKQDQSDRMVAALRAADKDVDYLVIEGEGHRIRHWKNRLKEYRAIEDFLAPCLGGRSSGFDYYQLGSWLF